MIKQLYLLFILFWITSGTIQGQHTPEILGQEFFKILKSNNLSALDTLIPNCAEAKEIYSEIDSSLNLLKKEDFCERIDYHNERLKSKCQQIRNDTTFYAIDWENTSVEHIEYSSKEFSKQTDETTKPIAIHYLLIRFKSNNKIYSIKLKGIRKLNNSWKLGRQIRVREIIGQK